MIQDEHEEKWRQWAIKFATIARKGAMVKRYHTLPTLVNQTVGAHSFGVAMLTIALTNGDASSCLLQAALCHDLSEQVFGDIPAPIKTSNPALAEAMKIMEKQFDRQHGIEIALTEDESVVLKWADSLDLLFFIIEERRLGNANLYSVFNKGLSMLEGLPTINMGRVLMAKARVEFSEACDGRK